MTEFVCRNGANSAARMEDVQSSCDCTALALERVVVLRGEKGRGFLFDAQDEQSRINELRRVCRQLRCEWTLCASCLVLQTLTRTLAVRYRCVETSRSVKTKRVFICVRRPKLFGKLSSFWIHPRAGEINLETVCFSILEQ